MSSTAPLSEEPGPVTKEKSKRKEEEVEAWSCTPFIPAHQREGKVDFSDFEASLSLLREFQTL